MRVGTRVMLRHDVERYPHFIADKGMVGTVTHADEWTICVRMDERIYGAEAWDNEIVWSNEAWGDDPASCEDFVRDVEVLS